MQVYATFTNFQKGLGKVMAYNHIFSQPHDIEFVTFYPRLPSNAPATVLHVFEPPRVLLPQAVA